MKVWNHTAQSQISKEKGQELARNETPGCDGSCEKAASAWDLSIHSAGLESQPCHFGEV